VALQKAINNTPLVDILDEIDYSNNATKRRRLVKKSSLMAGCNEEREGKEMESEGPKEVKNEEIDQNGNIEGRLECDAEKENEKTKEPANKDIVERSTSPEF
jgi:hypothetical protein